MDLSTTLALVAICVAMEGFFSGTEIALISLSKHRLANLIEKRDKAALMLEKMFSSPANLYGTTSTGTNIFVVTGVALMTAYFTRIEPDRADLWAVLVMSPLTLLLGEIIPKAFFQRWADRVSYFTVYPLMAAQKLFTPVLWMTTGISRLMLRMLGADEEYDVKSVTYEEIRRLFSLGERKLDLHPDEEKMIRRIFTFKDITAEQTMIPLIHLAAVDSNEQIESVRHRLYKSGLSRMPVYEDRIYNITGIINAFDVLRYGSDARTAHDLARPAFYVHKKKKIDDLLREMQDAGVQMAVVVNEYSAAIGIVTREDLVEEIFGEIEDEYDKGKGVPRMEQVGPNSWLVESSAEVDLLNDKFGLNIPFLPDEDYETIGGYILTAIERIPVKGEKIPIGDFIFTITDATEMGIREVEIRRKQEE